jgi:predicted TIM-barrel fold metal-dependent hydrolase
MIVTDVQVHLWEAESPDKPWPKPQARPPHKPNGFGADEMLAEMKAAGVDRAVIVPPTWSGDSNDYALAIANRHPERFAVIGRYNPKAPGASAQLDNWLKQPHMLGVRMSFHVKPFVDWLDDGTLDSFWAKSERAQIPVMALLPGIVGKLRPVAERHPELKVLIPHMGCVLNKHGAEAFADIEELVALARYPNVVVNVSSAPCFSKDPFPFRDIAPYLRRIYDAYGPHRMLWGADLSRLTSTYRECLEQFSRRLDFLSATDKEWILGKTLASVLNWPEPKTAPG